jgi:hypothetical protein
VNTCSPWLKCTCNSSMMAKFLIRSSFSTAFPYGVSPHFSLVRKISK